MANMIAVILSVMAACTRPTGASTAMELIARDPSHPQKCVLPDNGKIHSVGDSWRVSDVCGRIVCNSFNRHAMRLDYAFCGSIGLRSGCRLVPGDLTKPYPGCCPDVECDWDNGENKINRDSLLDQDINGDFLGNVASVP